MVDIKLLRMLNRLLWYSGFTQDKKLEWSDIQHDVALVSKQYRPEDDQTGTGIALGTVMENIPLGLSLGVSLSTDETYGITFHGRETTFNLNNEELYRTFEDGDRARVAYRQLHQSTYDFVPPDFDEIQLTDIKPLDHYHFVSAEKLE